MFETDRIKLRKARYEDVDLYHKWRNDSEVMVMTNPFVEKYNYEDTKIFMENVIFGYDSSQNLMIEDKETRLTIGILSLVNVDYKNRNGECIIDIGEKEFWNKGYGTEAMGLFTKFIFEELNLHRAYLRVFDFNKAAIRLYEKLGFKKEGVSREAVFRYGEWHDVIHMGQLQSEYFQMNDI